jgi:hypothetical protein
VGPHAATELCDAPFAVLRTEPRQLAFAHLQKRIRSYQAAGQPPPKSLRRREQSMLMEFMAE